MARSKKLFLHSQVQKILNNVFCAAFSPHLKKHLCKKSISEKPAKAVVHVVWSKWQMLTASTASVVQ